MQDKYNSFIRRISMIITAILLMLLIFAELQIFSVELSVFSLAQLSIFASLCMVIILGMVVGISPQGIWSASAIYLVTFSMFHFGLILVFGLGLSITSATLRYMDEWFFTSFTRDAIIIASIGFVSCSLGIHIALLVERGNIQSIISTENDYLLNHIFTLTGYLLTLLSICGWFLIVVSTGGIGILIGSYQNFLDITNESAFLPNTYYGLGLGMTFLAAARPSTLRRVGFIFFLVWSLLALPLGLRGEVLFPTLAALSVAAKRKIPLSMKQAMVIGVCLLSLIAFLRSLREVGLQGLELSSANSHSAQVEGSPIDALTELGSQLRPITEVVFWRYTGDEYIYGASYWAPFDRILDKVIPDRNWKRLSAEDDDRLMNQLAIRRVGPIGFSPVAEAYRNFGPVGVILIMGLTGFLLGRIDSWPTTQIHQASLGIILLPLLIQVRNDFIAVPFQVITGFLLLYSVVSAGHILRKKYETRHLTRASL